MDRKVETKAKAIFNTNRCVKSTFKYIDKEIVRMMQRGLALGIDIGKDIEDSEGGMNWECVRM